MENDVPPGAGLNATAPGPALAAPEAPVRNALGRFSPATVLAALGLVSAVPLLLVGLFPAQFQFVLDRAVYLLFHNIAEFFSIMVSLSIFGVGWYTHEQTKDQRALFLSTVFLAIGLMDFMHAMSNAAMPAFITPNSSNKSTQFWIAVRLFGAFAFLASAFVYPERPLRWLSKRNLLFLSCAVTGLVFVGVVFFPAFVPATFVEGVGLTPFKKISEYLVILMTAGAAAAYWRRLARTGDALLVYYVAAFIVGIFSELALAVYTRVFDTYNVLGHLYKIAAFYLIYQGIFAQSVKKPHVALAAANARLLVEISERRRAEGEVLQLNRYLERRVSERTAELEAANQELEAFAHSVSHDLRAPLRHLSGFVALLRKQLKGDVDEKTGHYMEVIATAAQQMGQPVDDLLEYSRAGRSEVLRGRVDPRGVLEEALQALRPELEGRKVDLRIGPLPLVEADPVMLRVVFTNLLGNALKFSSGRADSVIEIGGRPAEGGWVVFAVRDNGAGFDMRHVDKLFTIFQRLHKAEEFEGTGVGLAIVRRLVERHAGRTWAEGALGAGATFFFTLHAAKGIQEDP